MTNLLGIKGSMPSFLHKVNICVTTNGYSKFLKISDVKDNDKIERISMLQNPVANPAIKDYFTGNDNKESQQSKMQIIELNMS